MNKQREALEAAEDALASCYEVIEHAGKEVTQQARALALVRAALAEPEQEPVYHEILLDDQRTGNVYRTKGIAEREMERLNAAYGGNRRIRPLYTSPQPREWKELVDYILQEEKQSRLTPRVIDIAYTAWGLGRFGRNKDDGGHCDWFNDTRPAVINAIEKIRSDLSANGL